MDIEHIFGENFKALSRKDKEKVARKLLNLSEDDEAVPFGAAFFNPKTGATITAKDLMKDLGEEKAIEFIIEALETIDKGPRAINMTDYEELTKKAKEGRASDEELKILEFLTDEIENKDSIKFARTWLDLTVDLINFVQDAQNYEVKLEDLTGPMTILTAMSNLYSGNLPGYTNSDMEIVSEMTSQISKDIYDTWKASCKTLPSPGLIIIALMKLVTEIAHENNIKIGNAVDIANMLGIELSDDYEDDDEDFPYENKKGSNPASDKEKRNFLKED